MGLIIYPEGLAWACHPRQWDTFMMKPPQAGAMSDGQWSQFSSEMGAAVQRFKRDGCAHFALLLIPVGFVVLLVRSSASTAFR